MTERKLFPFNIGFCLLLNCSGALARGLRVAVVVGNHEVINFIYRTPIAQGLPMQYFGESMVRVFWRENEWQPAFCEA